MTRKKARNNENALLLAIDIPDGNDISKLKLKNKNLHDYIGILRWKITSLESLTAQMAGEKKELSKRLTDIDERNIKLNRSVVDAENTLTDIRKENLKLHTKLRKKGVCFNVLFVIAVIMLVTLISMLSKLS